MSAFSLLVSLFISCIGMGYFIYGKKQRKGMALLAGIVLCLLPYFPLPTFVLILITVAFMALPYFVRI